MSHLGGSAGITHTDEGALRTLIDFMDIPTSHPGTFVDVGCGPGGQVILAASLGLDSVGIDGDPNVQFLWDETGQPERFIRHDFNEDPGELAARHWTIGWSNAFAEHVEEQYVSNFMRVLSHCDVVCFMAGGSKYSDRRYHHHVNCKDDDYWIPMFESYGLTYNSELTEEVRAKSTMARDFIRDDGLCFWRKP
jgi:hypothetical protein